LRRPPTPSAQRTGIGYTEFAGRYSLLQGESWVASGQVTLRVPGTNDISNPAAIGYTDLETDIRGLFGRNFTLGALPGFVDVEIAQRFRSGGLPNELRADATFGLQVAPRWLLLAQSFNVMSEGAGTSVLFPSYEYYKLQLSAVYSLTPTWSVQGGGFTTFAGRNTLQENACWSACGTGSERGHESLIGTAEPGAENSIIPEYADRQVVADHQGGEHQA